MGVIYLARDSRTRQNVAIKILASAGEDESIVLRFHREARSLGNLKHPNIVEFLGSGEDKGLNYIVMEFVEGESIRNYLLKRRDTILEEGIPLLTQVCAALQYAHSQGVIHRDIKPDNILVTPERKVKIIDFGLAKRIQSTTRLTMQNIFLGTMAYVSPEQALDTELGPGTDIYALGVAIFEIFTDQLPFLADNPTAMLYKMIHEQPPSPSALNPAIPLRLNCLIQRMIEKDLPLRPASADTVARELDGILADLKSGAPPPALEEQMAVLDEIEARALIYASVIGSRFELKTLGTVIDIEAEDLPQIAQSLVRHGLLLRHAPIDQGLYSFPTEAMRAAANALIPQNESRYLEQKIRHSEAESHKAEAPPIQVPDTLLRSSDRQAYAVKRAEELLQYTAARADEEALPRGAVLRDRYTIDRVVARGANSTLYMADDNIVEMHVVLKEILPDARSPEEEQEFVRRFNNLCGLLVSMSHESLPGIFNFFTDNGRCYLVMEYIEGVTLEQLIANRPYPLPLNEFQPMARQMLAFLEYLHGIADPYIFMDLKPSHVMIDSQGRIRFVDFGLGRLFNKGQILAGAESSRGSATIGFCPVEQYGTGVVNVQSDLYSLGAVFYFILTGHTPPEPIKRLTLNTLLVPPSAVRSELPKSIDQAILKALELVPQDRWQTIRDFRRALPGFEEPQAEKEAPSEEEASRAEKRRASLEDSVVQPLAEVLEKARTQMEEGPAIDEDLNTRFSAELASRRLEARKSSSQRGDRRSELRSRTMGKSVVEKLPEKLTRETLSGKVLPLVPQYGEESMTIAPLWMLMGALLGVLCFMDGLVIERIFNLEGKGVLDIVFSRGKSLGISGAVIASVALSFIITMLNTYIMEDKDLSASLSAILFCLAGIVAACLFQAMGKGALKLIALIPANVYVKNFAGCAALAFIFCSFLAFAKIAAHIRDRGALGWIFIFGAGGGVALYIASIAGLIIDLGAFNPLFIAGSWGLIIAFVGASLDGWLIEKTEFQGIMFSDRGLAAGLAGGMVFSLAGAPVLFVLGAGTIIGGAITLSGSFRKN
jgi:serine/threonine protein kinase